MQNITNTPEMPADSIERAATAKEATDARNRRKLVVHLICICLSVSLAMVGEMLKANDMLIAVIPFGGNVVQEVIDFIKRIS